MYQKTTWQKQTTTISTIVKHPNQNPAKPAASKPESNMLSTMLSSDAFEELYKATSADIINFSLSVKKLTATPSCEVAACRDVRNARISAWKLRKTKCLHWQVGLQNLTEMFWNLHMELSAVRTCWMFYIECHQVRRKDRKARSDLIDHSTYIKILVSSFRGDSLTPPKAPLALSHREANWQADNHWSGPAPPETCRRLPTSKVAKETNRFCWDLRQVEEYVVLQVSSRKKGVCVYIHIYVKYM